MGCWLRKQKYLFLKHSCQYEPITPIWVDPQQIRFVTGEIGQPNSVHLDPNDAFSSENIPLGSIESGEWDRTDVEFSELEIFDGVYDRFANELPWEETDFYRKHVERITSGFTSYSSDSVDEFENKLENVDHLYQSMQSNGYLTQKELHHIPFGEIYVNISRNGELQFNGGGRHRLAVAKVLDIDRVPVQVLARHKHHVYLGTKEWKVNE